MKLQELTPAFKPGLALAAINTLLCALFGLGAVATIGLGAALLEFWDLPLPLFPLVVIGAVPITLLTWAIFAFRLDQPRSVRIAIAALGTLPLQATILLALFFAIWFVSMPSRDAIVVTGPLVTLLIASVATIACAAMVMGIRKSTSKVEAEPAAA